MAGLDTKTRLTVLNNSKDFLSWKVDLRIHLRAKKLWTLVEGSRKRPDSTGSDVTAWEDDNDKALAELIPTLGPTYKAQYQTTEEAPKLWMALVTQHESKGFVNRYNILLEIPRLTIAQCNNDVHAYCNRFAKLRDEQIVANGTKHQDDNFTSNQLTTFFVGGLQGIPRWEQFVLNLRQKEDLPSLEEVMALARDEQRLHRSLGSTPDTAIALSSQSQHRHKKPSSKRGMCRLHPQSNHKDEDCFVQHPSKRPGWTDSTENRTHESRSTMIGLSVPLHALTAFNASSQWAVDSGANEHCCNQTQQLFDACPVSPPVIIHGATGSYTCTRQGSVHLDLSLPNGGIQFITLKRVLYVPDLPINLLSSNSFRAKGVFFSNLDCTFRRMQDNKPFGLAPIQNGLNILRLASVKAETPSTLGLLVSHKDSSASTDQPSVASNNSSIMTDLWHKRLGHPGLSSMRKIQAATTGLTNVRLTHLPPCEVCHLSKSERKVSRKPQRRAAQPLQRIHIDLIGHIKPETHSGQAYIVVITDDFSRYRWTFFISIKGDAHQTVVNFINWSKLHCHPFQVLSIRIDQGTEFGITSLQSFCKDRAIELQYSAAYTPEQNGIAEASNKVILTKARAMMIDSGLPQHLWNHAISYATHIANRSASRWIDQSPFQLFWKDINDSDSDHPVDLTHLRRFGCIVYYHKPPNQMVKSEKFATRATRGYLLGMQDDSSTNFKIWLSDRDAVLHTPQVAFDESRVYKTVNDLTAEHHITTTAPFIESETTLQITPDTVLTQGVPQNHSDSNQHVSSPSPSSGGDTSAIETTSQPDFEDASEHASDISDNIIVAQPYQGTDDAENNDVAPVSASASAEGRSHRSLPRPDYRALHHGYLTSALSAQLNNPFAVTEPSTHNQALSGPQSEHWYISMQREIKQLEDQNTWQVVPELPPGRALIKGRWVFKIKRNPDHSIKEYKSRWVAKGFMQEEGIDYFETYAATLRSGTFRLVFALVAHYSWPLYQADITGAFLHSLLQDEIYMEAPHGFYSGQICKLLKSLYGLKQAPYLWYHALAKALEALGFLCLHADHCAFTNKDHDVFVLIFVDDIQITGSNVPAIEALRAGLKTKFALKELTAQTFLGLQIERNTSEKLLRLHQRPYAERILQELGFDKSKPVSTPMLEHSLLSHEGGIDLTLQKWYRKVVGSLNHLATYTRPDLAYAISCLSRHLHNPSTDHEAAAKRVLRYLRGTLHYGLTLQYRNNEPIAFGYSDSDWAGDADTRRSTSGYAFFVAGGLVSWKSRRQSIVTLSSTEAEYVALAEAFREAAWLRGLLTELGFDKSSLEPLLVLEDNQSTIHLATNHANSNRTKHVDVRNHYCRQEFNSGHVDVQYVPSELQAADGFTKPLKAVKWQRFLSLLRIS